MSKKVQHIEENKAALFERVFGASPVYEVSAAGRINIIGEHVDYCGGRVFPASLNLNCRIFARPNGSNFIRAYADDLDETAILDIFSLEAYKGLRWGKYQAGVAFELHRAGYPLIGCDLLYSCSVPFGSGLSSSAAIEVSTAVALNIVAGNAFDLKEMALLSQKAENEYCGVNCGIMDQFASAMGKKDKAILLDCKTLEYEYIPFELGKYEIVVANCNKPHNLVESKYNERRGEVEEALTKLKGVYPQISCLADVSPAMFEAAKDSLHGKIRDRAEHVVYECARVSEAADALRSGDIKKLAELINRSHDSLSALYEVTGKELDTLAYLARGQEGCIGARMIGAGFGGCTISIVEKDKAESFKAAVGEKYRQTIGYAANFYDTSIEDGVTVKKL